MSIPLTDGCADDSIWEPFKDIIYTLYIERNLSLTKVRKEMATAHQFSASKAQYELRFSKWGFRKNQTAEDWKAVARKVIKRKQEHKDSDVYINGVLINPKKVKKETSRYGSRPARSGLLMQPPSPQIPEGFIIRTPSPNGARPTLALATPLSMGPRLLDSPPFLHFNSTFSQWGTLFPGMLGSNSGVSAFLPQNTLLPIIAQSKEEKDWQDCVGAHIRNAKALVPESIFIGNPETIETDLLQGQGSSALDFLNLTIYFISNNFSLAARDSIQHIYKRAKGPFFTTFLKHLCSIGNNIIEKVAQILFPLAIDAGDFRMVKEMIYWGGNPSTEYSSYQHGLSTPLGHACFMQSVEMVQVLIDGGARLNTGMKDRAGATVNPAHSKPSPLATAARFGYAEIVTLLLAKGSDVNSSGPKSQSTPLVDAVIYNEGILERDLITVVRSLLQAGADIQGSCHIYDKSVTVLEAAIPRKSALLVQLLLNSGARITKSAFAKAAEYCDLDTVELFIKSGARVTQKIITCAAKNKKSKSFWFLLDSAPDDMKQRCKNAALLQCILDGNLSLIDKLAASGAELGGDGFELAEGIEAIVKREETHVLRLLLGRYHESLRDSLGPALTAAILYNQNDTVEMLLTAGASVNPGEDERERKDDPLSAAISQQNPKLIQRLLAAGAAVNKTSSIEVLEFGCVYFVTTVLPAVVSWGDYFLIQSIMEAGADIHAPGYDKNETALAVAINRGDKRIVQLLIDSGANVSAGAIIIFGPTALEVASRNNDLSMVLFLLGLGADPDEWSLVESVSGSIELSQTLLAARLGRYHRYSKGYGCRALQHAMNMKKAEMIDILLASGIDANTIVHEDFEGGAEFAFKSPRKYDHWQRPTIVYGVSALGYAIQNDETEDLWTVQMLLDSGADPNNIVAISYGLDERVEMRTALLEAIARNKLAIVKKLINVGADANHGTRGDIFCTPLQKAAEIGSINIIQLLLEHGADVNAPPHYRHGATALQFAAIGGYIGIAFLLLEKGADVNAPPAQIDGRTALEGAAENGRLDMVRFLLNRGAHIVGVGGEQYERALKFATRKRHDSIRRLLENYMNKAWESLVDLDPISIGSGGLSDFQF